MNYVHPKPLDMPFERGDLIGHKTTGAWLVFDQAVQGEAAGYSYSSYMAYTLVNKGNNGNRSFAPTKRALEHYTLMDGVNAHRTMVTVYEILNRPHVARRAVNHMRLDDILRDVRALRDSYVPAAVAQAACDLLSLIRGTPETVLRYDNLYSETSHIIAHWMRIVYGADIKQTLDAMDRLKYEDGALAIFPYAEKNAVLKKRSGRIDFNASRVAPQSVLERYAMKTIEQPKQKITSAFQADMVEDFGWFKVESNTARQKNAHRIQDTDIKISARSLELLRILHGRDSFVSAQDIATLDEGKIFNNKEAAVRSAFMALQKTLLALPDYREKKFLLSVRNLGLRMFKKGEARVVPQAPATIPNKQQDSDFRAGKVEDFGWFSVETDIERRERMHRVTGTTTYLTPTTLKFLRILHEANGPVAFAAMVSGDKPAFSSPAEVNGAFRDLRAVLEGMNGIQSEDVLKRVMGKTIEFVRPGGKPAGKAKALTPKGP